MNILRPDELSRFLDAAQQTPYYVYYSTLLYTGLRRGEALALRWRNVDLLGAELQVVETAFKLGDGSYVIKEPKTPHSCRPVSLPPSLAVLLRQYKADQEEERERHGFPVRYIVRGLCDVLRKNEHLSRLFYVP